MRKIRIGSYYRSKILQTINMADHFDRVLDVGSHDGYLLSFFPDSFKIAVDIALPNQRLAHPFVLADAKALPFVNDSFDLVLLMDVIEHIEDESGLAESLARILTKEGRLVLSTPSAEISMFPGFLTRSISIQWGHIFRLGYTSENLRSLFENNFSLKIENWNAPFFRFFYLPVKLISLLSSRLAFSFLDKIAIYDANHKAGVHGYHLLKGRARK